MPVASEAIRRFSLADQLSFAELSGDRNPMHIDKVASRRTQAGDLVVHGVHAALWALNVAASHHPLAVLSGLDIRFERFILVGSSIELSLSHKADQLIASVSDRDGRVLLVVMTFGGQRVCSGVADPGLPYYDLGRLEPIIVDLDEAVQASGSIAVGDAGAIPEAFPDLAAAIGSDAVMALARMSTIVGMACPGRDSIFGSLKLSRADESREAIAYRVIKSSPIFRLLNIAVDGGGWIGEIKAFVRHPPVAQPHFSEIIPLVPSGSFAGQRVLVIGGSRGIGEVAAKLAAAGGADVTISYMVGNNDAQAICEDIGRGGGRCRAIKLDVTADIGAQLAEMDLPTHIYYFATAKISASGARLYDPEKFGKYHDVYVKAFAALAAYCQKAGDPDTNIAIFYPSTVYVDERPKGMLEYAMAKAAGELVAVDITRFMRTVSVRVERLPRMLTDQTASMATEIIPNPLSIMLPLVEAFQS